MEILFQINKIILDSDSAVISESPVEAESEFYERKSIFKTVYDGGDFELIFSKEKYSQMGFSNITAFRIQSSQNLYIKTIESDDSGILCKYMLFTGGIDNLWVKNDSGEDAEVTLYVWGE